MRYLHTMVRVVDLDRSLDFYCNKLGLVEIRRNDSEAGRFTLVFLAAPLDHEVGKSHQAPFLELTHNWDPEDYDGGRNFGHLAYAVDNIYDVCQSLMDSGVTINRPPRDGRMAFYPFPRRHLHRAAAERRRIAAAGAVGIHGKHRQLVVPAGPKFENMASLAQV